MDQEFIQVMLQIEEHYQGMSKHQKIRVEAWTKKLCQVTTNEVWKRNRNLYSRLLLQQVIKCKLQEPFDKRPPEGPLPKLNKYLVQFDQKENTKPFRSISIQKQEQEQDSQERQAYAGVTELNEKLVKLVVDCRGYLDKRTDPEAMKLKREQDEVFQWLQDQRQGQYQMEQIDEQTEEVDEQQKDTMQFLQYLDDFEKKTERLKVETQQYLNFNNKNKR